MKIRELRASKSMTQDELAAVLGVKRNTVAMWETGKNDPRPDMLVKLARVLGCTPNDILGFEEEKPESAAEVSERDVPACVRATVRGGEAVSEAVDKVAGAVDKVTEAADKVAEVAGAGERDVPACAEAAESPEEPPAEDGEASGAGGEAERIALKIGAAVSDSRAEARRRKEEAFARAGLSGAAV